MHKAEHKWKDLWPVDGYKMHTDIYLDYHSHLSTTFNPTVNKPIILTGAR